jgi:diguanylate cyclase
MSFSYNPYLVALSIIVAIQAGYVGLSLALRIPSAFALRRRLLIAGSAITLAVGIWSMHFIGMLAIITTSIIDYLVLPTLLSFLVCVLVTGVAIYMASLRSRPMLIMAAAFMGFGIATMHYVGMIALHSSVHMTHDHVYVLSSVFLAVAASGLALWLAFLAQMRPPLLIGAIAFGCAVSGMHYVAMAGTSFMFMADPVPSATYISSDILAAIVSVVAFSISAIFMLALIPMERKSALEDKGWKGSAPMQEAQQVPVPAPGHASLLTGEPVVEKRMALLLPIEKNGNRFHISANDIASVHANAHYTYLFNGRDDLFCPLSISEVEQRLPKTRFFRTHRSYIINLAHVDRIRKAGDAAIAELDTPVRRTVPVGRARVALLRQELVQFQLQKAPVSPV